MKTLDRLQSVLISSYGHWKVTIKYKGKLITHTTTNSRAVDAYNSEYGSRRRVIGAATLIRETIAANSNY